MTDKPTPIDDGGPAFPMPGYTKKSDSMLVGDVYVEPTDGMSLRDWFAGMAMAGRYAHDPDDASYRDHANDAYRQADAMLKERSKQ